MPFCTKCGTELSEGGTLCSNCGSVQNQVKTQAEPKSITRTQSGSRRILGALVVTIIILGIVIVINPTKTPAPKIERSKIFIDTTPKNIERRQSEIPEWWHTQVAIKIENNNDAEITIVGQCTLNPRAGEPGCREGGVGLYADEPPRDSDTYLTLLVAPPNGEERFPGNYGIRIRPHSSRDYIVGYFRAGHSYAVDIETRTGTYTDYLKLYLLDKDGSFKQNLLAEVPITITVN